MIWFFGKIGGCVAISIFQGGIYFDFWNKKSYHIHVSMPKVKFTTLIPNEYLMITKKIDANDIGDKK